MVVMVVLLLLHRPRNLVVRRQFVSARRSPAHALLSRTADQRRLLLPRGGVAPSRRLFLAAAAASILKISPLIAETRKCALPGEGEGTGRLRILQLFWSGVGRGGGPGGSGREEVNPDFLKKKQTPKKSNLKKSLPPKLPSSGPQFTIHRSFSFFFSFFFVGTIF